MGVVPGRGCAGTYAGRATTSKIISDATAFNKGAGSPDGEDDHAMNSEITQLGKVPD